MAQAITGTSRPPAERRKSGRRASFWAAAAAGMALPFLGSCGENPAQDASAPAHAPAADTARTRTWLEKNAALSPGRWLAERETGASAPANARHAAELQELLTRASHRFGETPRMIANRAVQLETMLGEQGVTEGARSLIEGLLSLSGGAGRAEGFGALCQQYFTLRTQGLSRAAVLAGLERAYGPAPGDGGR